MQAHIHLIGDVAEIAPAAGGAAVVHLEVLDDALGVDLDRLGILAADVEYRARVGVHHMGAEPVAENFGADLLLRKRQGNAAVAGADNICLFDFHAERRAHGRMHRRFIQVELGRALDHPAKAVLKLLGQAAFGWPVLDIDDRLVVGVEKLIKADAGLFGDFLADLHDARSGDVAEEIGFALGAALKEVGRLRFDAGEHLVKRFEQPRGAGLDMRFAGFVQILELLEKLFEADGKLDLLHDAGHVAAAGGGFEAAAEQRQAGADARFLLGDGGGGGVVGARIGDALAEHLVILVHQHRLGGGRAEVDSDIAFHGFAPATLQAARCAEPPPRRF